MLTIRLFKVAVGVLLLQFVGYLIINGYTHSWNIYSSPCGNGDTMQLTTVGNLSSSTVSNIVDREMYVNSVIHEVTALMKAQLESNFTVKPYSWTTRCAPNSKSKDACVQQNCTQLSNNLTERIQSLYSEKTILTKEQDDLLGSVGAEIPENDVIILSAASSNHYDEMQALLHSLHSMVFLELSKTDNFSLVLWDIGLTSDERKKMEKCCRCQVISFPFEKFPIRVKDLHTFMWKPLIIRITQLRARKYVVWQDASIRYVRFPGPLFERAMHLGVQLVRDFGMTATTVHYTLPETFAYFGQNVCSFSPYPEIAATFGVYKHDPFVLTAVTNPWARCAFEEKCMSPRDTIPSLECHYGPCHRFDQSALTIITATLYGSKMYRIVRPATDLPQYIIFRRDNKKADYFHSIGCLK